MLPGPQIYISIRGVSGANYYKLYHKSNYIVCKFDNEFKVNKNKN